MYIFDLSNQDAYILKLWYLVYSQIWTNLRMIVTNGYITKLQKEKHCSILYANQGFFFPKLWYGEFGDFSPNYLVKLFEFTVERQISPEIFGLSKKMFKNAVQSLFKLHNVGPFILWIYRIILKMNHTPCQNERISVLNRINKQYSWKRNTTRTHKKRPSCKAGESNPGGPL